MVRRHPAPLFLVPMLALATATAFGDRPTRRGRTGTTPPPAPAAAPSATAHGDDPATSDLALNQTVDLTSPGSTLHVTGSRAWPVASALAFLNEDGTLVMLLHSSPIACPSSLPERQRLANMVAIDCPGRACRLLLLNVPLAGGLRPSTTSFRAPSEMAQQAQQVGAAMQGVDMRDPAAVQAALAQMQQLAQRPATGLLAWKNTRGASLGESASGGQFTLTSVEGSRIRGSFSLQFPGEPSPHATGTATLDGTFDMTICSR